MVVRSALGDGMQAEIDVTSLTSEEAATLAVRVASPETYRASGMEYSQVLASAQVVLMRRADGRPYLRLSSDRAVQEPYVEAILEVSSSSGRLRRDYTMLFDPPGSRFAAAPPAAPVAPVMAAAPKAAPAPTPAAAPVAAAPRTPRAQRERARPASPSVAGADQYEVRPGDSLSQIALDRQRPGVSLDQMLAGLYRANPEAFVKGNINKVMAGAVLKVPSADEARAMSSAEARRLIVAQSVDFGAYRARLAEGAPAAPPAEAPARSAQGKVQAAVEDRKQAAAASADKLRLSGGAVTASAPQAAPAPPSAKPDPNDIAARIAELSRSIEELKRLQQAQAAATTVAAAPAAAATPTLAPAPAEPPAPLPVAASAPAPAPEAAPTAASAPPTPTLSAPVKAPPPPSAATPPEPSLLDSISESPLLLPGAGILALLVAGGAAWKLRGRFTKSASETSFLESKMQPDSFFGASGGQRVDTRDATTQGSSSIGYSLSQLDAIGDVDPVAEADVYLAYGRDLQAEEILKEAMRATPERMAIRTKLLEVYAKRRDTKGFELLATQLYSLAKGTGPDWEKAQELGRQIDPDNPLYQPGGQPEEIVVADRIVREPLGATTLPQSTFPPSGPGALTEPAAMPRADSTFDLDLDLDLTQPSLDAVAQTRPLAAVPARSAPVEQTTTIDFDLTPTISVPPPAQHPGAPAPPRPELEDEPNSLRMDLEPSPVAPLAHAPEPTLDFDNFSLSEAGGLSGSGSLADSVPTTPNDFGDLGPDDADPLARKFELAEEFRQIGDLEGARDLLEEVIAKAGGSLQAKARAMLDDLG